MRKWKFHWNIDSAIRIGIFLCSKALKNAMFYVVDTSSDLYLYQSVVLNCIYMPMTGFMHRETVQMLRRF